MRQQQAQVSTRPWQHNAAIERNSRDFKLMIDHAFSGVISTMQGSNTLPVNRLYFCLDECGYIKVNNRAKKIQLKPNSIYFIPPNNTLYYNFISGRMVALHFNVEIFPGLDVFENEKTYQQKQKQKDHCQSMFDKMASSDTPASLFTLQGELLETLTHFCQADTTSITRHSILHKKYSKLLFLLENNLNATTSVGALAEQLDLTRDQLSKSFNRDFGMPLKKYLCERITREAASLLLSTASIKEIAKSLSFGSEFYFSRFFKKQTGMPPSVYRKHYMPSQPIRLT